MHKDTFELVNRQVLYQKESYPTNAYYQRLWVTLRDFAPDLLTVVKVVKQDIAHRQQSILTATDGSYILECEQYIERHKEFLALVSEKDAYLYLRDVEQEAA